jgi:hypothetical protein
MEVKEDDESFRNAVDYMFKGLEKRKPDCFAVKQYKKYRLASGQVTKSIFITLIWYNLFRFALDNIANACPQTPQQ